MADRNGFRGFPAAALRLLRCPVDGGALQATTSDAVIVAGAARCDRCGLTAPIADGILDLMDPSSLDEESTHELALREQEWADNDPSLLLARDFDRAEMDPHIAALGLRPGYLLLELGCGTGRFTVELGPRCAMLVAVDFSRVALRTVARRNPGDTVALVRADIQRFATAPQAFDGVLSTLTSNLPTTERRRHFYAVAAAALKGDGVLVSGTHFYGLGARLAGVAKDAPYNPGGIYRWYTTRDDVRTEIDGRFADIRMTPVQILVGVFRRLGLPPLAASRRAEHIPLLREFGHLLMTVARRPQRD